MHHHHLGNALTTEVALRGWRENQTSSCLPRQPRQLKLTPSKTLQAFTGAALFPTRHQNMGQFLEFREHCIGINANSCGLPHHRPVIEQHSHQAKPIKRRRANLSQLRAQHAALTTGLR